MKHRRALFTLWAFMNGGKTYRQLYKPIFGYRWDEIVVFTNDSTKSLAWRVSAPTRPLPSEFEVDEFLSALDRVRKQLAEDVGFAVSKKKFDVEECKWI